ncbi:Epimerase family protein [Phycisphaerae bacterium RAS1]|nr:Epimerase family protein [Phycisphaerae bacterium RAS1]
MPVSADELFAWHARPGALQRLLPPDGSCRVVHGRDRLEPGSRVTLSVPIGPFRGTWVAEHGDFIPGRQFTDVQTRGPMAAWKHTHRCIPDGAARSVLEDEIEYRLPGGKLGAALLGRWMDRQLTRMFEFRHQRTRADLERHALFADRPRQRVIISGATGLVGSHLAAFLRTGGHRVEGLSRGDRSSCDGDIRWNPARGEIETAKLDGADVVVHLAGQSVAGLWTARRKRAIRESRVNGTTLLCRALARLPRKPHTLISASAIGYYGDRSDEELTEDSSPGTGFLADVAREWEAATVPARDAGIRVIQLRIGVVLAGDGGALAKMKTPFSLGLGGVISDGRQFMSWIAIDDLIGVIHWLMFTDRIVGPLNAVAPRAVTNRDFTKTLGRVLRRPTILPAPAAAVRLLLGEFGRETLLAGARVRPAVLEESGFPFLFPTLEAALRFELGR